MEIAEATFAVCGKVCTGDMKHTALRTFIHPLPCVANNIFSKIFVYHLCVRMSRPDWMVAKVGHRLSESFRNKHL